MKIICMARNYAAHAAELHDGGEVPREPVFFLKPDTALLRNNDRTRCITSASWW